MEITSPLLCAIWGSCSIQLQAPLSRVVLFENFFKCHSLTSCAPRGKKMIETHSGGFVSLKGWGKEHAGPARASVGWSTVPYTKRLRVPLLFKAYTRAAGWVPDWVPTGGNFAVSHIDASLSLSPFPSLKSVGRFLVFLGRRPENKKRLPFVPSV